SVGSQGRPYNVSTSPKAQATVLNAIRLCDKGPSDGSYVLAALYMIGLFPWSPYLLDRLPSSGALEALTTCSLTMDSHPLQSSSPFQRARATSNLSLQSIDARGAIPERLHQLALDPWSQADSSALTSTSGLQWITPEHSPQAQPLLSEPSISDASIEALSAWSVPTPPQSDSGVPSFCLDSSEKPVIPASASPADFQLDQAPTTSEMSSLGFLLPSQYGPGMYESEPHSYTMDQNYMPPIRNAQPPQSTNAPPTYTNTLSSSPALYQSRTVPEASMRRQSGFSAAADSPMDQNLRRVSTPYDSSSGSQYSMSSGQTIPSISGLTQNSLPSPHIAGTSGSSMSSYGNSMSRSPGLYDSYPQHYNNQPPSSQSYAPNQSLGSYPPPFLPGSVNELASSELLHSRYFTGRTGGAYQSRT
ncbi:hypothetical protein D0863_15598, partial [Hortaea werneckii]